MENQIIVESYMRRFGVPYTPSYLRKRMEVIPFAESMLGLATILSEYNIPNRCVRVSDDDVLCIDQPFITMRNGGFIIAELMKNGEVTVTDSTGKCDVIPFPEFTEGWNRVILVGNVSEKSYEPEFAEHRHEEKVANIIRIVAVVCCVVIMVGSLIGLPIGGCFKYIIGLLSGCGVYISYLLLEKDLDIPNRITDRICGIIKENSCSEVTQSKGAELFGVLHLSEIGAAYFSVNLLAVLYIQEMWNVVFAISLCVLPFTFWSVWYQKFKAHTWCALCLCIVALLWIEGCIVVVAWNEWEISFMEFIVKGIIMLAFYVVVAIGVHYLMRIVERSLTLRHCERAYNHLKTQPLVLRTYEMSTPQIDINPEVCSTLIFGNPDARQTFTIMSNPYCWPCAMMHRHIKDWPGDDKKIQCVFISVSQEREIINKYFIAAYQQLGQEKAWKLMCGWFDGGKEQEEQYFENCGLDLTTEDVRKEMERHRKWHEKNRFAGTPVVLLNGHELQPPYSIDDYVYMNF